MDHNTWAYLKTIGNKLRDSVLCYAYRNNSDKKNVKIFKVFSCYGFLEIVQTNCILCCCFKGIDLSMNKF